MKRIKTIGIAMATVAIVAMSSGSVKADGLSMTNETVLSSDDTYTVISLPVPSALESPVPRRVLTHSDGSLFVLAYNGTDTQSPYIYFFDPTQSSPTATSISTDGLTKDSSAKWTIGDIAFTSDYYLLGCTNTCVGGTSYSLSNFYLYAWEPSSTDSSSGYQSTTLRTLVTIEKETSSTWYAGNNYSNFIGSTLTATGNYIPTDYSDGSYNNFLVFFDNHAGNSWTTSHGMRIVAWQFRKTSSSTTTYNSWFSLSYSIASSLTESTLGNDRSRLEILPTSNSYIMTSNYLQSSDDFTLTLDGTATNMYDMTIENLRQNANTSGSTTTGSASQSFTSVSAASYGGTYFSYDSKYYLITPVATSTSSGYDISVALYDITDGLSSASSLGQTGTIIESTNSDVPYMSAHAVVASDGSLAVYLVVDDQLATISGPSSSDSGSTGDEDSTDGGDTGSTVESTSGKTISSSWSSMDLTTNSTWVNNNTTSTTQGIRRALYNDDFNKIYVLAYGDGTINEAETSIYPYLYEVTPPTIAGGDDWTVSSLDLTNSSENGVTQVNTSYWSSATQTAPNWWLSDIAFTSDNYLIGTNSITIRTSTASAATTGDFYMWSWTPSGSSLSGVSPVKIYSMVGETSTSTSTSSEDNMADIYAAGGTASRLMSNSFTIDGEYSNFWYYFDSHPGNSWSSTYYDKYYMLWNVSVSDDVATREYFYGSYASGYSNQYYGQDAMITLSPFTSVTSTTSDLQTDQIVVDGSGAYATDFVLRTTNAAYNSTGASSSTSSTIQTAYTFSGVAEAVKGTTFFSYGDYKYLVTPTYEATTEDDGSMTYSFGVSVYELTGSTIADSYKERWSATGVISYTTTDDITDIYMTAFVDLSSTSTVYLMVDDVIAYQQVAKSKLVTYGEASRRIFAYNANMYYDYDTDTKYKETQDKSDITGDGDYVIEFDTNIAADEAYVTLTDAGSTTKTTSATIIIDADGPTTTDASDYHYTITITPEDVVVGAVYSYEVTAKAGDITTFKLSAIGGSTAADDSSGDTDLQFYYPISVGVDANPSSPYFGNVYVGSSQTNSSYGTGSNTGIYVLDPQDDLWNLTDKVKDSSYSSNPYTEGATWTGLSASGPRYIAVADDGDVFTCDWGTATNDGTTNGSAVEGESYANSGIYYFNPANGETSAVYDFDVSYTTTADKLSTVNSTYGTSFETSITDATYTSPYRKTFFFDKDSDGTYTYIGGSTSSVAVRGSGEDRHLLTVDDSQAYMTSTDYSTRSTKANYQHYAINRYNIGENETWDTAPTSTYKDMAAGVGVGFSTIVPISQGIWIGQHRDRMCNYEHVPMMFYYSDTDEAIVWTSYDEIGVTILGSSESISYTDDTETRGQSDTDLSEFSETRGETAYDSGDECNANSVTYYYDSDSSWRGGFAVFEESETSGIIAQSLLRRRGTSSTDYTRKDGIRIMRYTLPESGSTTAQTASTHTEKYFAEESVYGKPTVTAYTDDTTTYFFDITSTGFDQGIAQMAFDYVGNLYIVSYLGHAAAVYTLPTTGSGAITGIGRGASYTNDNGVTTTISLTDNSVSMTSSELIGYSADERTTDVEEVEEDLSITDKAAETKIFPNPATSYVTVVSDQAINTVQVYSMGSGSLVRSADGAGNLSVTVDIDGLAAGVYIVKVNGISSHKLIKK